MSDSDDDSEIEVEVEDENEAETTPDETGDGFETGDVGLSADVDDAALDQSEIDDLFDIAMDDDEPVSGIHALLGGTHLQYRRLPLLEACFDRLLTTLSSSLRNLTWEQVELSLADITSTRFQDYIDAIPMPALISVFKAVEWNGTGLITIDSPLIYAIIDVLLGGRRTSTSLAIEGRSFTAIETSLIERAVKLVLDEMILAFKPICEITFEHDRLESNPALASIVPPTATGVVFKIDIDMDDRGGRLEVLIPDATLEPVLNLLQQGFMGDKFGHDPIWEGHWTREVRLAEAEVEVTLGHQMMSLRELMDLEVGSTLKLNTKPGDQVTLTSGRIPLMRGKVGQVDDAVAIQVENWIAPAKREAFKTKSS
ncbi:MAG: flagellar motor switch protein FliM [Geminicoccaceae bacterium]